MNTVEDSLRKANALIDEGRLPQAAELIEASLGLFPTESQSLFYCLLCIHSLGQEKQKVLECFDRARASGVWWSPSLIASDTDFSWLLNDPDFKVE